MTLVKVIGRNKGKALRAFFGVIGIVLLAQGATALTEGEAGFKNYWGGFVSAPFAIIMGLAMIGLALGPGARFGGPSLRPSNRDERRKASKKQAPVAHHRDQGHGI